MQQVSTAPYQRARAATLRGLQRQKIIETARKLMRDNQKRGKHYTRAVIRALTEK